MSKFLCSLVCVCATLAIVSFWGEVSSASDRDGFAVSDSPKLVPGYRHGQRLIVRVAKKKTPRKKTTVKKGAEAAPAPEKTASAEKPAADGNEKGLKFSRDIAPIFVNNCTRCHNEKAMAKNGKLDLTTYERIRKGATHEEVIVPGKPEESHLYLRLTGDETPKMPRQANQRPLSENAVEKVGQWIKEGAKLDAGIDAKAQLGTYAASPEELRKAALAKLPSDQREKVVEEKGLERWKKGNAKAAPEVAKSKNFLLIGVLPKDRVSATLKAIEAQYPMIVRMLGGSLPAGDPLEKIGLYVFNDRTSFVEFVRSNEGRELEATEQGTAKLNEAAPYVAVVDPLKGQADPGLSAPKRPARSKKGEEDASGPERSLTGLAVEYLATGLLRRDGDKAPLWLTYGFGAVQSARIDPRSPYIRQLRRAAYDQFEQGWISKASDALGGETKPENVRAVGFGIVEALAANLAPQAFVAFVHAMLAGGDKLDDTLQNVLGMTREQFLGSTGNYVAQRYGRSR